MVRLAQEFAKALHAITAAPRGMAMAGMETAMVGERVVRRCRVTAVLLHQGTFGTIRKPFCAIQIVAHPVCIDLDVYVVVLQIVYGLAEGLCSFAGREVIRIFIGLYLCLSVGRTCGEPHGIRLSSRRAKSSPMTPLRNPDLMFFLFCRKKQSIFSIVRAVMAARG